jgi:retron-type reverse transcriptase
MNMKSKTNSLSLTKPKKKKTLKKLKSSLKATIQFSKKIAKSYSPTEYYVAQADYIKNLPKILEEKKKYAVKRKSRVDIMIALHKQQIMKQSQGIWNILLGMYKKNQHLVKAGQLSSNSDLLGIVSSVPMLMTSYKTIKGNKGAMTLAAQLSSDKINMLDPSQRAWLKRTAKCPDGISRNVIEWTSKLLKSGKYPWGASRRIYIPKPGQLGKLRPLTIPPFMDRVVQEAIRRVLESIYEPIFEHMNKNFGFRPAKGSHDCIYALSRGACNGFYMAIEGDIKAAYDQVNREKLIEILRKRIRDRKFLELIRKRLNYEYLDTQSNKHVNEDIGIPQGGIDSPYLWNIYMLEFDEQVVSYMDNIVKQANDKLRGKVAPIKTIRSPERASLQWLKDKKKLALKLVYWARRGKSDLLPTPRKRDNIMRSVGLPTSKDKPATDEELKNKSKELIRDIRKYTHTLRSMEGTDPNQQYMRYAYCRYADDFIITGNFPQILAEKIKNHLKEWLEMNLHAHLSVEKTLITDMREKPAHFLGFELKSRVSRKIGYAVQAIRRKNKPTEKRKILRKTGGYNIVVSPDSTRLLNRLFMKGYCTRKGFPRELSWLSTLESFTIIERYNSVLRGLANFYAGFITNSSDLDRWLYIIRYSCLKTLAQKYKTTINGIFKRFKAPGMKTVQVEVTHDFGSKQYVKKWRLLTNKELKRNAINIGVFERVRNRFEIIETDPNYQDKITYNISNSGSRTPRVVHFDFLEKIHWVNIRASAPMDLPCFICGSMQDVEMHHIKHVRKRKFSSIPDNKFWEKLMALRNRKQVPVCRKHHMELIHKGAYTGPALSNGAVSLKETTRGYDNRLVHLESFVKPGEEYFAKSLEEKGWVPVYKNI